MLVSFCTSIFLYYKSLKSIISFKLKLICAAFEIEDQYFESIKPGLSAYADTPEKVSDLQNYLIKVLLNNTLLYLNSNDNAVLGSEYTKATT